MKKIATRNIFYLLVTILTAGICYFTLNQSSKLKTNSKNLAENEQIEEAKELNREQSKKVRAAYFFMLTRDPATNSIPNNIRSRELNHARSVPTMLEVKRRLKANNPSLTLAQDFNWQLAGPPNIGGRTRALGIDQRNSSIIIAGGVSGGIWRSTDSGNSWTLRTPDAENFSVTSLAQDPTNPDTWYYTAGEFTSSSQNAPGAPYFGSGIFRSTDNGLNWAKIPGTEDTDTRFDSQFDFVNRIMASPNTGTIFVASNGFGIFRSANGNDFNTLSLGGAGEHLYADVTVASDGTLYAVVSSVDAGNAANNPGIFISTNDGTSWTEITPASFPTEYGRSVITSAPSNPDMVYVLTRKLNDTTNQGVSLFRIDLSGGLPGTASDQSANLPNFTDGSVGGTELQGGYNMTINVKPDNPDFVLLGGTNLFRSTDGFATGPSSNSTSEKDQFWVGGYAKANDISQYSGQHPDQHGIVFDPSNPNRAWTAHDGGLSVSNDITASSVSWTDRNNGYVVTQYYDVSIPANANDTRLMGGTQDNGTPFFNLDQNTSFQDISSGDGGYSFFTENYIFASNQRNQDRGNNRVILYRGSTNHIVQPQNAETVLFINPYDIDPQNQNIMYYPGGNVLWRNTRLDEIDNNGTGSNDGTTTGWEQITGAELPSPYIITALKSTNIPNNILYYAGSDTSDTPQAPILKRLDNASVAASPVDISIPNAPSGGFIHDIAVNPANGSDVLVAMSNYNIVGLYHTSDAGNTWQPVEGNLTGNNTQNSSNPGPSIRSATIISAEGGPVYMVGTSTGVYATQNLDGTNTTWGREAPNTIGASLIENITSRFSNGDVAVGSHGRGIFFGSFQGNIDFNAPDKSMVSQNFPNPFSSETDTSIPLDLSQRSQVTVSIYDISGQKIMQPVTNRIYQPGTRINIPINFSPKIASGIYLYQLIARPTEQGDTFIGTGKMTYIN